MDVWHNKIENNSMDLKETSFLESLGESFILRVETSGNQLNIKTNLVHNAYLQQITQFRHCLD